MLYSPKVLLLGKEAAAFRASELKLCGLVKIKPGAGFWADKKNSPICFLFLQPFLKLLQLPLLHIFYQFPYPISVECPVADIPAL